MTTRASRRTTAGLLVAVSLAAGACSSATAAGTATSTTRAAATTTSTTSTTVARKIPKPPPAQYVVIDGKRIRVPTETSTYPIMPLNDQGQNVIIEAHTFLPHTLYASSGAIVFTNLTDVPQTVSLVDYPTPADPTTSGPIPPGGTFVWHHTGTLALKYTGSNGSYGYLNVATVGAL